MAKTHLITCPVCSAPAAGNLSGRVARCGVCGTTFAVPTDWVEAVPAAEITRAGEGGGFRCPFCKTRRPPAAREQVSAGGWVVFAVMLFACFPLCFIGLTMKESYRVCSGCRIRLD